MLKYNLCVYLTDYFKRIFNMDNFNARYEKELAYQEITSNKYTLYGILLFIGVELLIWILNIIGFFELDNQIMSAVIGSSIYSI